MPLLSTLLTAVPLTPANVATSVLIMLGSWIAYKVWVIPFLSPLNAIPGPPKTHKHRWIPFAGNFLEILADEAGKPQLRWIKQYGGMVRYSGPFNKQRVLLADQSSLNHVLYSNSYDYHKPDNMARVLGDILGHGILVAEDDIHRKQRKMMNPAFGHRHVKEMVKAMIGPAAILAGLWSKEIDSNPVKDGQDVDPELTQGDFAEINVVTGLSRCTLDVIGLAAFGYSFDSLTTPSNELNVAYTNLFYATGQYTQIARAMIPYFGDLPIEANTVRKESVAVVKRVSLQLIESKRAKLEAAEKNDDAVGADSNKDLLAILIQGNEQVGSLEGGKLTDKELTDQIMTFLAAGHETTSVTVTWALHILSLNPHVQTKLRQELWDNVMTPNAEITYDLLAGLPYLNAFIKEVMRLIPPVPTTSRVATKDDVINGYPIPKGTQVFICPAALHHLPEAWGDDVEECRPERWMEPDTESGRLAAKAATWAYLPFMGGPRNCIGSKFALIEAKVILYELLKDLQYAPKPDYEFKKRSRITIRPIPGMVLRVSRVTNPALARKEE